MRSIISNKRGQLGGANPLGLVIGLVAGISLLIFLYFAFLYAITTLNPTSFFTTGTASANSTNNMINNLTAGGDQVSAQVPTLFKIGIVVVMLGFIGMMIGAIYLFMRYGRQ
jgi:hypothetical protein